MIVEGKMEKTKKNAVWNMRISGVRTYIYIYIYIKYN